VSALQPCALVGGELDETVGAPPERDRRLHRIEVGADGAVVDPVLDGLGHDLQGSVRLREALAHALGRVVGVGRAGLELRDKVEVRRLLLGERDVRVADAAI
jgi:hypothetical protein